jgi:hypothetical protein
MEEFNTRYRNIETSRLLATKFSNISQGSRETAEEYGTYIERLFDKAHGYRDRTTNEDLAKRFLDEVKD